MAITLIKTFSIESVAYEFGAGRGIVQYQFPTGNQPDTEADNIALGFVTMKTDAVLLRVESANTQDYFELEIVRTPVTCDQLIQSLTQNSFAGRRQHLRCVQHWHE